MKFTYLYYVKGVLKRDHIKRLIKLTSDNIKRRLSLYKHFFHKPSKIMLGSTKNSTSCFMGKDQTLKIFSS